MQWLTRVEQAPARKTVATLTGWLSALRPTFGKRLSDQFEMQLLVLLIGWLTTCGDMMIGSVSSKHQWLD